MLGGHGETYMGTGTLMVVGVAVVGKSRDLYVNSETYGCRRCGGCKD